jgi:hypothetical protein
VKIMAALLRESRDSVKSNAATALTLSFYGA